MTCRDQEPSRFEQGEADHAGVAAGKPDAKPFGATLNGVSARFPMPLATCDIGVNLVVRQTFEAQDCFGQSLPQGAVGAEQRHCRIDPVPPARQQRKTAAGRLFIFCFGQDALANPHHCITSKNRAAGREQGGGAGFFCRQPHRMSARLLCL